MSTVELDAPPYHDLLDKYEQGERVAARLPGGGAVRLDPEVPFLFAYRRPSEGTDAATARLLGGEASVLLGGDDEEEARQLVAEVCRAGARRFGAFLLLELWAGTDRTRFVVHAPDREGTSTIRELCEGLRGAPGRGLSVTVKRGTKRSPPGREPWMSIADSHEKGVLAVGLAVPPVYRSADGTDAYPVYLRTLRGGLSRALRRAAYDFLRVQTSAEVSSYRALGPRTLDRPAVDADRELAEIERSYALLLLVSPVDQAEAWERFRDASFDEPPEFHYRLLPVDPDLLKRRLFAVELEEVDDPALSFLLSDKREELDRQISLLLDRNTPAFRPGSVRLYGTVDDALIERALRVLDTVKPGRGSGGRVGARAFARRAREEFARYASQDAAFRSSAQVRPDLVGLMVSEGQLLVGEDLSIAGSRLEPLIAHEVGTHVLTWCNGAAQPLRQLSSGLASYDELQEGLAVFAEYLVGGIDAVRMRVLAARVVAAASVQRGANFVETFRILHREHALSASSAFDVSTRVHACGGFTRDAIYLRGLVGLLEHLEAGGALEPLYIGKLALRHLDVVEELRERGILAPPPYRPLFLDTEEAARRLQAARTGLSLDLLVD